MTLGFKTKRKDGTKTNFVEKIWAGFALNNDLLKWDSHLDAYGYKHNLPWEWFNTFLVSKPKLHSIRDDKPNRWKAGNNIHFVIGNRTKERYLFCPIIPCISVQKIKIEWIQEEINLTSMQIQVDDKQLNCVEIENLSINDGFDSLQRFMEWFNEDFEGKIIHWTNLKY